MFAPIFLTTLIAALAVVRADPNPTEPGPGEVYNEGATCHIAWDPDTTGTWKTMNIELMTGPNSPMVFLKNIATVDGTDPTKTTYDYPCPQVSPNSAIYFYQFTSPDSPDSPDTLWTTRFTIADASGNSVPPANANQPNGAAIPWGTGALANAPAPAPASTSSAPAAPSSSSVDPAPSSSTPASVAPATSSSAAPSSAAPSSSAPPSASPSSTVQSSVGVPSAAQSNAASSSAPVSAPATFAPGSSSLSANQAALASSSTPLVAGSPSDSGSILPTGATAVNANGAVGMLTINSRVTLAAAALSWVAFAYMVAL